MIGIGFAEIEAFFKQFVCQFNLPHVWLRTCFVLLESYWVLEQLFGLWEAFIARLLYKLPLEGEEDFITATDRYSQLHLSKRGHFAASLSMSLLFVEVNLVLSVWFSFFALFLLRDSNRLGLDLVLIVINAALAIEWSHNLLALVVFLLLPYQAISILLLPVCQSRLLRHGALLRYTIQSLLIMLMIIQHKMIQKNAVLLNVSTDHFHRFQMEYFRPRQRLPLHFNSVFPLLLLQKPQLNWKRIVSYRKQYNLYII